MFKNIVILISGTGVSQLVVLLATPLLSRLYTPADFGMFAIIIALAGIAAPFSTLRYETAILIKNESYPPASLLLLCLGILSVFTLCVFLVSLFLLSSALMREHADKQNLLYLLVAYIFVNGLNAILITWHSGNKRFGVISSGKLIQAFGIVVSQILLITYLGSMGLLYGYLVGVSLSCMLYVFTLILKDRKEILTSHALEMIGPAAKKHKNFPLVSTWSSLLNSLLNQLPSLLFAKFFSTTTAGHFSMANRIIRAPLGLLGQSIYQVLAQRIGSTVDNEKEVTDTLTVVLSKMAHIVIIPFIILTIYLEKVVELVLGQQWFESGDYAQIITPWVFTVFMSWPLTSVYNSFGYQKNLLIFNAVFVGMVLLGFSTINIGFDSKAVLVVISVLGCLSRIAYCHWVLRKLDEYLALKIVMLITAYAGAIGIAAGFGQGVFQ